MLSNLTLTGGLNFEKYYCLSFYEQAVPDTRIIIILLRIAGHRFQFRPLVRVICQNKL